MPWVNVSRALVPLSLCDLAATHIIKACGGEEVMKQTLGGTKWWQVRETQGYAYRCHISCLRPVSRRIYRAVVSKLSG